MWWWSCLPPRSSCYLRAADPCRPIARQGCVNTRCTHVEFEASGCTESWAGRRTAPPWGLRCASRLCGRAQAERLVLARNSSAYCAPPARLDPPGTLQWCPPTLRRRSAHTGIDELSALVDHIWRAPETFIGCSRASRTSLCFTSVTNWAWATNLSKSSRLPPMTHRHALHWTVHKGTAPRRLLFPFATNPHFTGFVGFAPGLRCPFVSDCTASIRTRAPLSLASVLVDAQQHVPRDRDSISTPTADWKWQHTSRPR